MRVTEPIAPILKLGNRGKRGWAILDGSQVLPSNGRQVQNRNAREANVYRAGDHTPDPRRRADPCLGVVLAERDDGQPPAQALDHGEPLALGIRPQQCYWGNLSISVELECRLESFLDLIDDQRATP